MSALVPRLSRTKLLNFGCLKDQVVVVQDWAGVAGTCSVSLGVGRATRGVGDRCPRVRARRGHSLCTVTLHNTAELQGGLVTARVPVLLQLPHEGSFTAPACPRRVCEEQIPLGKVFPKLASTGQPSGIQINTQKKPIFSVVQQGLLCEHIPAGVSFPIHWGGFLPFHSSKYRVWL